jgi:MOSC domain-containing protein YiiM
VATARVEAVSSRADHYVSKRNQRSIRLLAGRGVEGDAHCGPTVQHRSRVRRDPTQPNLRQVHLIHRELYHELAGRGFELTPGEMGENVTTSGVELLDLPRGTRLRVGERAILELTGLRNPCKQLEGLYHGLMSAVLDRDADGNLVRKAGVMAIVAESGTVVPGDPIDVLLPPGPHEPLEPV